MIRLLLSVLILISLLSCSGNKTTIPELHKEIESEFEGLEGTFAVAYLGSDGTTNILINENERFHAASTMKTPVMIELFKQAELGNLSLDDSLMVTTTFSSIVDGSPFSMAVDEESEPELSALVGKKTTYRNLNELMITKSSNLATNILIGKLDAKKVTQTMRTLGADSIEVLRGVEDIKAFEAGLSNSTTAADQLAIFTSLKSDTLISAQANKQMIEVLKAQHYNDMIPAKLPEGTEVAHKTGWITGVHHDSGIVYLPDGRSFVLIILSKEAPDREAVLNAGANISRMLYEFELK